MTIHEMKLTDYLAVWGAVIATLVAAWNVYKDIIKRDRVIVTARFTVLMPGGKHIFSVQVTNLSDRKIRIVNCAGFPSRKFHRPLVSRLLRFWRPYPKLGYVFVHRNDVGHSIPSVVEPRDSATFCFNVENFPVIEELYVITADNREWYCRRSYIRAMHKDSNYISARAADSARDVPS